MWKCKYCEQEMDFKKTSEKANHSRWCDKNPKRNDTSNLKLAQEERHNKELGKFKEFEVECHNCKSTMTVEEREFQFPIKEKYFCSRNCANSTGGKAKADKLESSGNMKYQSVARRNHEKECIVCGFDKIVEVHHINEVHSDNRKENLVFLCPNHHSMYHSRYKEEIVPYIEKFLGD